MLLVDSSGMLLGCWLTVQVCAMLLVDSGSYHVFVVYSVQSIYLCRFCQFCMLFL